MNTFIPHALIQRVTADGVAILLLLSSVNFQVCGYVLINKCLISVL